MQKGVQTGTSKVYLIKWPVSVSYISTAVLGAMLYIYIYIYIYSGYGKYSDPLKFFTLCYIAAIC